MRQLLIATTNQGKYEEIKTFLWDLPFEFISLNDLKDKPDIELSLPNNSLTNLVINDLKNHEVHSIQEETGARALTKIKYYLQAYYGPKQVVVPFALIIKDGKVLMTKRNDPTRPDYHEKWEFPGGKNDLDENTIECVIRETLEETGYKINVVKMLQHIEVDSQKYPTFTYQVFLLPFVCVPIGQPGKLSDAESLDAGWYDLDDVLKENLVPTNARMYEKLLPELKQVVKENNL